MAEVRSAVLCLVPVCVVEIESLGFKCTLAFRIFVTLSFTTIAPSIFDNSESISGENSQSFKVSPPEESFSNFVVEPMTISAPAFLSAIKSTPILKGWPGNN